MVSFFFPADVTEETLEEYRSFLDENLDTEETGDSLFTSASKSAGLVDKTVIQSFQKAQKKVTEIAPFEQELLSSEPPHLSEYYAYIQHEKDHGDPARVQNLYERALKDNCLVSDLWVSYIDYVRKKIKV